MTVSTTPSTLVITRSADRVVVQLNRPEVRNAINQQMVDELHAVCAELEAQPRILIITGSDGVFASGADIAELRERTSADALTGINTMLFIRIAELPMPVIAAVDGYALGGGAELAYAADFRIGTPGTKLGNPETGLGIIAPAGALWRLRELVGEPLAKEVLLAGRILGAEEALATRLLTRVVEPGELLAAAHALADEIAAKSVAATIQTKAIMRVDRGQHPQLDLAAQAVLFDSDDKRRRMTDFLERKKR
ncbi:MAG: enoyl-CoA hydratase/isomerase family protein [Pseudolysinimonas sp.]